MTLIFSTGRVSAKNGFMKFVKLAEKVMPLSWISKQHNRNVPNTIQQVPAAVVAVLNWSVCFVCELVQRLTHQTCFCTAAGMINKLLKTLTFFFFAVIVKISTGFTVVNFSTTSSVRICLFKRIIKMLNALQQKNNNQRCDHHRLYSNQEEWGAAAGGQVTGGRGEKRKVSGAVAERGSCSLMGTKWTNYDGLHFAGWGSTPRLPPLLSLPSPYLVSLPAPRPPSPLRSSSLLLSLWQFNFPPSRLPAPAC